MIGPLIPFQVGVALCCFGPILLISSLVIFLIYLFGFTNPNRGPKAETKSYDKVGTPSKDMEDKEEVSQVNQKEHPSKVYSEDESSQDQNFGQRQKKFDHQSDTVKSSEKSRSFLDKLLNRKKMCEECGTELEYRDAYESYYCPNCRTFK